MGRDDGAAPDAGRRRFHASAVAAVAAVGLPQLALAAAAAQPAAGEDERPVTGQWVHAYAAYGRPLYPADFKHFGYVNPDAPKGGALYLGPPDRRTSFDKLNYFTLKGNAPAGLMHFMFEPLVVRGADEPMTMYGVLAESMLVAPDHSSVTFRLHPKARFHDGDPVLAEDVKHSLECVSGPKAGPEWQATFAAAAGAVVIDERTVRIDFKDRSNDAIFKVSTFLQVFSRKWGLQPDGRRKPFDEIVMEPPITSGPYKLGHLEAPRRIEFVRNPDYWGRDIPTRRGMFNFDRVVYRLYEDEDVMTEAFKAGEFDILRAYRARVFARRHSGRKWDDGRIIKAVLPTETVEALQSYQINLRRPLFQDIRVRQALGLTWNFELSNRYKTFEQCDSLFNNSQFAAQGLPSAGELALLEPFRAELPKEVFGPPYRAPRNGDDPNALRRHLLQARALFEAAGWKIAPDGRLRNAEGQAFEFEYLGAGEDVTREIEWGGILEKLGITLRIRKVDFALYVRRLEEFDFDTTTIAEGHYTLPSAQDYLRGYASQWADVKGSDNLRGVKSKAVDAALAVMSRAETLPALRDACRALDRIVMWNHWQVPQLFKASIPLSYWNKFDKPAKAPRYYTVGVTIDIEPQLAWPELCWWPKNSTTS